MNDTPGTSVQRAGPQGTGTASKAVRYLFVLLLLGFAWRAFFMFRDPAWLTNFWLFEDFGYSLKIAKNIASGLGETFDGIVPTNGYQPLYVWLMAPVFLVFKNSLIWPVYVAVTLLAIANVATGAFIFMILRRLTGRPAFALLATAFWMFNFAVVKDGTNGLETGLSTMMVAASLHYYFKHHHAGMALSRALFLGCLLGVSFLARVDAVFLAAAVFTGMLCDRTIGLKARILLLVVAGVGFLLFVLPYAWWNLVHFGSPLPTSGQVTTEKASLFAFGGVAPMELLERFQYGCYIVYRILTGNPSMNGWVKAASGPGAIASTVVIVGIGAFCTVTLLIKARLSLIVRKAALVLGLMAMLYMYGYTIHTFKAFERYFLPVILALVLLVPLAACSVAHGINRTAARRIAILSCLGAAFFLNTGLAYLYTPDPVTSGWFDGATRLNAISQPGDVVAAMQTGNTGYFYRNGRAINLDGVVNLGVYQIRKQGDIDRYLREQNVKYIADERGWIFQLIRSVTDPERQARLFAALSLRYFSSDGAQYAIYELLPDNVTTVRKLSGQGWTRRDKEGFTYGYAMSAATPGSRLDFTTSGCFALKLMKHSWSGKLDVLKDGVLVETIDLYAPTEDTTFRRSFQQDGASHQYSLVVSKEKNPSSHGMEVWLDAVLDQPACGAPVAHAP